MRLTDCPGCAQRREAMRDFARKVADWVKRPTEKPPLDPMPPTPAAPTSVQDESLARIRALMSSNKT